MSKINAHSSKPSSFFDASDRNASGRKAPPPPVLAVEGKERRQALKGLAVTAGQNRAQIFRDDFKDSANVKAEGVAYREVEIGGVKMDVISKGTLESSQRKVGKRLSLDETLTNAGYDVAKMTRTDKLKVLDALNDRAEMQVGRQAGKWLAEQAAKGREGQFSTRIQGVNGQTYLVTAKASFDDAIRRHAQGDAWSDWSDRGVIPGKAEHQTTGRDGNRRVYSAWDKAEGQLGLEKREKAREPIIQQLKYDALFGDGSVEARTQVEGSSGVWDFDVEVEKFKLTSHRVDKELYDGNTADFLGELVRAARANERLADPSKSQVFDALRLQLNLPSWKATNKLVQKLLPTLDAKPTPEQLKGALLTLTPEQRKELKAAEQKFFDGQLGQLQYAMISQAVQDDLTSVKRSFVFGDKKYELKLELGFEVEVHRHKAPLLNRALGALITTVGLLGGVATGVAFAAGAANAAGISAAVAGTQALLGGVNALSTGDFKGFALSVLSAAGSGMFGSGGFQQFAKTASTIAGGVEKVVSGKNFLDTLSGVASLAGVALNKPATARWATALDRVSDVANLGSAVVQKDALGIFTAAMALANGELGRAYSNNQRARYEAQLAESLNQVVESAAVRPFSDTEAQALLNDMSALESAIDSGMVSVRQPGGGYEKLTPAKLESIQKQYGSVHKWVQAEQPSFGLQMLPDELLNSMRSWQNKRNQDLLFKPLSSEQARGLLNRAARGELTLEIKEGARFRGLSPKELRALVKDHDTLNELLKDGKIKAKAGNKEIATDRLRNISTNGVAAEAARVVAGAHGGFRADVFQWAVQQYGVSPAALLNELMEISPAGTYAMLLEGATMVDASGQPLDIPSEMFNAVMSISQNRLGSMLAAAPSHDEVSRWALNLPDSEPRDGASVLAMYFQGTRRAGEFSNAAIQTMYATPDTQGNRQHDMASAALLAAGGDGQLLTNAFEAIRREALDNPASTRGMSFQSLVRNRAPAVARALSLSTQAGVNAPVGLVLEAIREATSSNNGTASQLLRTPTFHYVHSHLASILTDPAFTSDPSQAQQDSADIGRLMAAYGVFADPAQFAALFGYGGSFRHILSGMDNEQFTSREHATRAATSLASIMTVMYVGVQQTQSEGMLGAAVHGISVICNLMDIALPPPISVLLDNAEDLSGAMRDLINEGRYGGNPVEIINGSLRRIEMSLQEVERDFSETFSTRLNTLLEFLPPVSLD